MLTLLLDNEKNLAYICTDASRKAFKIRGENGEIIKDPRAINLTNNIAGPIRKKASEHAKNISERKPDLFSSIGNIFCDIHDLKNNNSGFITELASLTSI